MPTTWQNRFSEQTSRALAHAYAHARQDGRRAAGTSDLWLGLLSLEDSVAVAALSVLDVDLAVLWNETGGRDNRTPPARLGRWLLALLCHNPPPSVHNVTEAAAARIRDRERERLRELEADAGPA
ncbi:hypothetical protein ABZ816_34955 [Actinosynnema sp. NPDC047251]|uniref:Clp R domain-containing protein n=1 Tax=Saccharothrix espanaensis (strain ATCC 51144 / DSM 44229 / JCM 9112 / NBRC 15066 / NRRL 15764) TaxID=1179773 RepID=K0JS25_SACES|nr:hypothetical protein [Saccharothrix espanaensis]CCH28596.1 hypothetical protein BN6_12700 [Saccharothrix espanaensis DSM 44229]